MLRSKLTGCNKGQDTICCRFGEAEQLRTGREWKRSRFRITAHSSSGDVVDTSNLRPDLVLWSKTQHVVYFVKLTETWEDAAEMA